MPDMNPFPDYPVAKLTDARPPHAIIETDQIQRARGAVETYTNQWPKDLARTAETIRPVILAVRGDYGSGKTFLLLDAMATLRERLAGRSHTVLRFAAIEADPVGWYQAEIGPRLAGNQLAEIMTLVYAEAAKKVASEVALTEAAVERLNREPRFVYQLINSHLLNRSRVDATLADFLRQQCKIGDDDTRAACQGLIWDQTTGIAQKWFAGRPLDSSEKEQLRISQSIITENAAAAAITAVASIHAFLRRPLGLFIDELEHLVRFDRRENADRGVTWMKRLLESLAGASPLMFVAGHWDAWEGLRADYLDRFTAQIPIDMLKLAGNDVRTIVERIVPLVTGKTPVFSQDAADAVARLAGGNFRRVITLLRALFDSSAGFSQSPAGETIEKLFEEAGQKLSLDQATQLLQEILGQRGIEARPYALVNEMRFDLAGYQAGRPRIVFALRHALTAADSAGDVKRFLAQFDAAHNSVPGLIGCFIADGSVDTEVLSAIGGSDVNVIAFDLTRRDVLARITAELDKRLGVKPGAGTASAVEQLSVQSAALVERIDEARRTQDATLVAALEDQRRKLSLELEKASSQYQQRTQDLERQIAAIERKRITEIQEIGKRVDELTQQLQSEREKQVTRLAAPAESDLTRLHVTYTDLMKQPTPGQLLNYGLDSMAMALALFGVVAGIASAVFFKIGSYDLQGSVCLALAGVSVLALAYVVRSRALRFSRFHDFRVRTLREIYARSESPEALISADNLMRNLFDHYGWPEGMLRSRDLLGQQFGLRSEARPMS